MLNNKWAVCSAEGTFLTSENIFVDILYSLPRWSTNNPVVLALKKFKCNF